MKKIKPAIAILLASVSAQIPNVAYADDAKPVPPTVEQLGAFSAYSSFSVSPDGKNIAALEARGEDRVILIWPADNLKAAPKVLGSKDMKIQSVQFIKNDLLAVSLWQPYDSRLGNVTKTFISKLYITDIEGKKWREPIILPRAKTQVEEDIQSASRPEVSIHFPPILIISSSLTAIH